MIRKRNVAISIMGGKVVAPRNIKYNRTAAAVAHKQKYIPKGSRTRVAAH